MYWTGATTPLVMKGSGPRLRLWFEQPVMARMSPVGHCTVHSAPGALWRHDPTRFARADGRQVAPRGKTLGPAAPAAERGKPLAFRGRPPKYHAPFRPPMKTQTEHHASSREPSFVDRDACCLDNLERERGSRPFLQHWPAISCWMGLAPIDDSGFFSGRGQVPPRLRSFEAQEQGSGGAGCEAGG
jgi:hypothetical protein